MGLNFFTIGGTASLDHGIIVSRADVFGAPARVYEEVAIPGRNGSLLFDEGRYENITIAYECILRGDNADLAGFRSWLASFTSYVRPEDTYHPQEYRMAVPISGLTVETSLKRRVSHFTVYFSCKPQRFLKSGDQGTTYTAGTSLLNPTRFPAKPLIRVYGNGVLTVGSVSITIAPHSLSYIDLDCDLCDACCGSTNANQYVSLSGTGSYPALEGNTATGISWTGSITSIVVRPRWWTL